MVYILLDFAISSFSLCWKFYLISFYRDIVTVNCSQYESQVGKLTSLTLVVII